MTDEKKTSVHYTPAGWVKAEPNHDDFICVCTEEGKQRAEEIMKEVAERLKVDGDWGLTTLVVASLAWDYEASITGIYFDQWGGVSAQKGDGSWGTFIQCDRIEHGIAATWLAFAEHEKEVKPSGDV